MPRDATVPCSYRRTGTASYRNDCPFPAVSFAGDLGRVARKRFAGAGRRRQSDVNGLRLLLLWLVPGALVGMPPAVAGQCDDTVCAAGGGNTGSATATHLI